MLVCGIISIVKPSLGERKVSVPPSTSQEYSQWEISFLACSLGTILSFTILIGSKLLRENRLEYPGLRQTASIKLIKLIVESAALCSALNIVALVLYVSKDNTVTIVHAVEVPVIGITVSLMIIGEPIPLSGTASFPLSSEASSSSDTYPAHDTVYATRPNIYDACRSMRSVSVYSKPSAIWIP